MKIAVLGDIHGNAIALNSVLEDSSHFSIERFFILGDLVGYYYWPKEVLDLLKDLQSDMIQGNHERMLEDALDSPQKREAIRQKYGSGIEFAINTLSDEQKKLLSDLSKTKVIEVDGLKFLLCHGSPINEDQYIYPNAEPMLLDQCVDVKMDFIFMAHTHYPFITFRNGVVIANPGSVGQPRDIGCSASYLIVDTQNKTIVFRRVRFDPTEIMKKAAKVDPNLNYLQDILMRNVQHKETKHGLI